ncbi:proline--tRNA ligase [Gracilibacillus salitolerans]|uniref:Proline--tRNA ligase n=1 Tax=Gracilibacillus salitolerans TaxID=2663022 RepID=A0A5Q2TJR3_9BACI|nr:proline--tRNA ligase [Gracilibacillus salitolerans]QGH34302.1 proline--tRNA ligase [Gracilibacillus salitolerans]
MSKQFVKKITSMEEDFAQWYTDVVTKAKLIDYSSVRGSMIIRPYGYEIWENIKSELDTKIKETGHENVYMPLFIPESLLQKEKDHIEGFAPEVAWVTHGGQEELQERLCVRPTSEVIFAEHYKNIIHSYRDLPKLYNQWSNVVRWEKTTRPFLRTLEFLWQEGHTCHETETEAINEAEKMLTIYSSICTELLAIPVIKGEKTEKEKFAGAKITYTVESLMHDGKALQTATSHFLGDGFAKAFGIEFLDRNGKQQSVHQTSWGFTTRVIGAMIMVHGDNRGLVIPPKVAPTQVVIIPIAQHKEGVLDQAYSLEKRLSKQVRINIDASDKQPGWKFNEYEMQGVPIRLEIGPKDIAADQVVLVRRDTGEKLTISLNDVESKTLEILSTIQDNLYMKASKRMAEKTTSVTNMQGFQEALQIESRLVKAMWCGNTSCEDLIKEKTGATSRCIPYEQESISDKCVYCGRKADKMVYWAKAY